MICLKVPVDFYAVGQFFENFDQVTDEDVVAILKEQSAKVSAVG
jgi:predicted phosphoribosyltransferase